ncbi:carboxypeptidase S [Gymnopus androsaceus JB14]|uniref:Carboxypeptidase S n=1 Tax=Gymnopus androsaceus JB14 TaxID=1447944 RepID=A0A6A4GUX2_9AGAR|nr:carboxypeptidase S [Gymnopus androsaceus JB14]
MIFGCISFSLALLCIHPFGTFLHTPIPRESNTQVRCPQVEPILPIMHETFAKHLDTILRNEEYVTWAYESLIGAVQIPTESPDDLGQPGEDPRWNSRLKLLEYIQERFPLISASLERTIVNHFALIYHWTGMNTTLKPILLTAHQGKYYSLHTIPVDPFSLGDWIYPPFSGHFDGEWIFGRGSIDCKSDVFAILTAVELLLEQGFKPTRGVVLAFGMDEERGGTYGGPAVQDYLLSRYGENGFSVLIDEGTQFQDEGDIIFAKPGVAEKGWLDVRIEVKTRGGHSMMPPRHTSAALLSLIVSELDAKPPPAHLFRTSPFFEALECSAEYDRKAHPHIRDLTFRARKDNLALEELQRGLLALDEIGLGTYMKTSQAVVTLGGGSKSSALPTSAWAIIDHRIADWSSVADLESRYVELVLPLVKTLNLSLTAFGENATVINNSLESGHVEISSVFDKARDPSAISPTFGNGPWDLLAGTISGTLQSALGGIYKGRRVVVQPELVLDTAHYSNLTQHIFRYAHAERGSTRGMHDINEAIRGKAYLEMIRFIGRFVLNADETDLLD